MMKVGKGENSESNSELPEDELEQFRQDWLNEVNSRQQVHESAPTSIKLESENTNSRKDDDSEVFDGDSQRDFLAKFDQTNYNIKTLSTKERQKAALEIYKGAVSDEKKGKLGEALDKYRRAFKLDADVDLTYRTYCRHLANENPEPSPFSGAEEEFEFINHIYLTKDYVPAEVSAGEKKVDWEKLDPMHFFIQNFLDENYQAENKEETLEVVFDELQLNERKKSRSIIFKPADQETPCHIGRLPDTLLLRVLHFLQLVDFQAVGRFSSSCIKGMFLARDNMLWATYGKMLYHPATALYRDFRLQHPTVSLQTYINQCYDGKWRFFLIDYPRLRFDGIYISTCTYIRQGASENTFSQPIHLVTYFRYLRFYPNGTCLSLLTNLEPSQVVHQVNQSSPIKELLPGHFSILPNEVRISVSGPHRPGLIFNLSLELKSTSRGRHNKLSWLDYSSWGNDDVTNYSLKQFKPYYFSKVKSYKIDWSDFIT